MRILGDTNNALETDAMSLPAGVETSQTIAEIIAEKIKTAIFDGTLPPGHRLREVELVDQMKTSRTPIREAFRILQSSGYLVHMPRCGVVVAGLDGEEMREMWELRSIVESAAAARAARYATREELDHLNRIHAEMEAVSPFSPLEYNRLDAIIHKGIAKASRNRKLEENIIRLWQVSTLARTRSLFWKERVVASCREHRDVIVAIERGDGVLAARYMEVHFENSIKTIDSMVHTSEPSSEASADAE